MHVRVWDLPTRSASMGIWAGNVTLPLKSTSSNYVRHLGRPEKLSIIYVFTSVESRADIFSTPLPIPHQPSATPHPCVVRAASNSVRFAMFFWFFLNDATLRLQKQKQSFMEPLQYIYNAFFLSVSDHLSVLLTRIGIFFFVRRPIFLFFFSLQGREEKNAVMALMAPSPSSNVSENAKMHLSM